MFQTYIYLYIQSIRMEHNITTKSLSFTVDLHASGQLSYFFYCHLFGAVKASSYSFVPAELSSVQSICICLSKYSILYFACMSSELHVHTVHHIYITYQQCRVYISLGLHRKKHRENMKTVHTEAKLLTLSRSYS